MIKCLFLLVRLLLRSLANESSLKPDQADPNLSNRWACLSLYRSLSLSLSVSQIYNQTFRRLKFIFPAFISFAKLYLHSLSYFSACTAAIFASCLFGRLVTLPYPAYSI